MFDSGSFTTKASENQPQRKCFDGGGNEELPEETLASTECNPSLFFVSHQKHFGVEVSEH